jgi:hypothetical protein
MKLHELESLGYYLGTPLDRLAVPGGWLYRRGDEEAATFVPDPDAEHCQFENIVPAPYGMLWCLLAEGDVRLVRDGREVGSLDHHGTPWGAWTARHAHGRHVSLSRIAAARWLVAQVEEAE